MSDTTETQDQSHAAPTPLAPQQTIFDLLGRIEYDLANLTAQREQVRAQIAKVLADAQAAGSK